jgi:hypothetical protein
VDHTELREPKQNRESFHSYQGIRFPCSGRFQETGAGLLMGVSGGIGSTFGVLSREAVATAKAAESQDWATVQQLQERFNTVCEHGCSTHISPLFSSRANNGLISTWAPFSVRPSQAPNKPASYLASRMIWTAHGSSRRLAIRNAMELLALNLANLLTIDRPCSNHRGAGRSDPPSAMETAATHDRLPR